MNATTDIPVGGTIDLSNQVVGLDRSTGRAVLVKQTGGPPRRIAGYTVSAPRVAGDPPHAGEMHPDTLTSFCTSSRAASRWCWNSTMATAS